MNWMSILGICLIVLGTVFSFLGTYQSDKRSQQQLSSKIQEKNKTIEEINNNNIKLISQNSALLSSNKNVSTTNQDLIDQNTKMLSRVSEYQKDIEERDKQIKALENEVDNVKEYGYYANLDIYGRSFIPGVGIKFSSDLSNRMEKVLTVVNGQTYVKNEKSNIPILNGVIKRYPNFPFGYFAKAIILEHFHDKEWRNYAKKAINIFEITTTIKGHNHSQDEALAILKRELATNK